MHIGFDAKRAFTNNSGLGNYSRFVISSLLHDFPQNNYQLYTPRINENFQNFYSVTPSAHVVKPQGLWEKLSAAWRVLGLTSSIKEHQLDLFHGLSNELPLNIRRSKAKAIVTIHDLIFLHHPELYKPIDRAIYNYKFRRACEQAHRIIAISQQTKQDIINFFHTDPAKIEVIYQDCDPIFHQACDSQIKKNVQEKYGLPEKYLLCVGTLEPRKNQLNLLKAWHSSGAAIELVFVGRRTAYYDQLNDYVKKHKLEATVHFMPYIPFQELPAIYQMATTFAYPSIFEGFGIPIIEALNSGVPVITSTDSCFSEAGGKAALYIAPDNVHALAQAIYEASTNQPLRSQMIKDGYEHALLFRPEVTIAQLYQLYKQVLQE
ncbi:glycosyltransferase family 4 protein [Pontibacter silvestris]|uniref:Glycosyltransferase family 4 protein n=1 Tax=Pontibacter silvestris TaxID=2305183 RepID=A0ABW4X5C3_9BACT|nr:glycosyltransferase family 1 protein [Pontibacter silvestris]MCC9137941.1 glycosyltransferase family 4 protein [Pontibacter silvestris]